MRLLLLLILSVFLTPVLCYAQPAKTSVKPPEVVLETGAHTAGITDFAFTPDGTRLISISKDKTIRFWDLETTECLKVLRPPAGTGNDGELEAMVLSGNGKILAVSGTGYANGDNRRVPIYIIDLATEKIVKTLEGHTATIKQLSISDNGSRLVSCDETRIIRIWDSSAGKLIREMRPKTRTGIFEVSMAPDGVHTAAAISSKIICYKTETGEEIAKSTTESKYYRLAWHPDSKRIVGQAFSPHAVHFLSLKCEVEKELVIDVKPSGTDSRPHFSRDGSRLFLSWGASVNQIVDATSGKVLKALPRSKITALSPDGNRAACTSSGKKGITIWNQTRDDWDKTLPAADNARNRFGQILWKADGKELLWELTNNSVRGGFDLEEFRTVVLPKQSKPPEGYTGSVMERDGVRVEKGPITASFVVKDLASQTESGRWLRIEGDGLHGISLLAERQVAIGTSSGKLHLFKHDGTLIRKLDGHNGYIGAGMIASSPNGRYLTTISSDNVMKIWDLKSECTRPVLSGYMQLIEGRARGKYSGSAEWIAWTPEGYYACSADGEKLIRWLTPGGPDQLGSMVAPDRFRKQFHRPDVLRKLIELGSLENALAFADKERGIKTEQVPIEDAFPPSVMLEAPASAKDGKATVKVTAVSQGKFPVLELQLLVDGRPLATALHKFAKPTMGKVETTWTIDIPPGQHQLNVVARTQVSTGLSSSHDITFTDASQAGPSLHVLSVGINSYSGDWKLTCAANDAKGIRQVFEQRSAATYRGVSSKLLIDAEATKTNILAELASLKKNVKPQDVAVIFFAGHGIKGKKGAFYLCPHGTDFADVEKTGISNDEIKRTLAQMQGRILVMLDACHSGASRLDEFARELTDDDCGVIVMCAAMGRESAGEEKKLGHGYFAKAIIDGLGGKADVSKKDNQIYLHHLESYVIEAVQEWSGDEQHPVMSKPMSVRSFALAKAVK